MSVGIRRWLDKCGRFCARPSEDRALIVRAVLLLPATRVGIHWLGFQRWKQLIEKLSMPACPAGALSAKRRRQFVERAARAVRSAELHGPVKPNCLERSMTLWYLLRRKAIPGELRVGARKEGGRFEAHAWVELDGKVLNDRQEVHHHYASFDCPIAATPDSRTHLNLGPSTASKTAAS